MPTQSQRVLKESRLIELICGLFSQSHTAALAMRVRDLVAEVLEAERISVFIGASDRMGWWLFESVADEPMYLAEIKGIAGEVVRTGRTVLTNDDAFIAPSCSCAGNRNGCARANILCVPIIGRNGAVLGAVEAISRRNDRLFTKGDEEVLSLLGPLVSSAMEHVKMAEEAASLSAQFRLLLAIQENIDFCIDAEKMIEVMLGQLVQAVGGLGAVVETVSRDGIVCYYSHHIEKGFRYWEEVDRRSWPRYLARLRSWLKDKVDVEKRSGFFRCGQLIYTPLEVAGEFGGYLALELSEASAERSDLVTIDCVKVVADQLLSLIDKYDKAEEKQRFEKRALAERMLATVVHDIKNPLSGVSGFAQLIKRRSTDRKIHEFCDIILDSLSRIERMNNELLLCVRGESFEIERSVFSFSDFFRSIINTISKTCERSNICIEIDCPPGLIINADRERLHRVFTNVLSNAREAIGKNGIIRVTVAEKDGLLRVSIADTGRGIPARILEHIFEPFVTCGKAGGKGVGLSMAKNIIEKHEGAIDVKSVLGKGTTVTVMLPIAMSGK